MEYTIKKIAHLSGVSARTLRYYDELGLLKPKRVNSSGYRIYGEEEIDRLQQILFYRSLDMKLEEIKNILDQPDFQIATALEEHHRRLLEKRSAIDALLYTVEQTLRYQKGEIQMSNKDKFEAFKQEQLRKNEAAYGKEIREKYGEQTVVTSNKKFANLTEEQFKEMNDTEEALFEALSELITAEGKDVALQKKVAQLHKQWLSYSWPEYSLEAHKGLAETYLADERFAAYYNGQVGENATNYLVEAIKNQK
ncbi:hypothetical protein IGI37_002732 [Enterococcus sp. AZ194]|uniref:MerR family transcriptional regulator n=1 Tax=Enterococcus sp. AZ194 TaxID=2774629 RepID=UPI003F23CAED